MSNIFMTEYFSSPVKKESRQTIVIGFGLILILTLSILSLSYTRLTNLKTDIETINNEYHAKANIVHKMLQIVSERSLSMHNMRTISDPFIVDEEYLQYNALATRFVLLRVQLENLLNTATEKTLFSEIQLIIRRAQPLQNRIVDNFLDGHGHTITLEMMDEDRKDEQRIYGKFNELISLQNESSRMALIRAEASYNQTLELLFALSLFSIIIGAAITFSVIKRVTRSENAVFKEKEKAEVTLKAIGDAVITTDIENRIVYMNPVAETLTQSTLVQMQDRKLCELIDFKDNHNGTLNLCEQLKLSDDNYVKINNAELTIKSINKELSIEGSAATINDERKKTIGKVIVFRDVSENKHLANMLSWQASHDPLTGLANRREFEELLGHLLKDSKTNRRHHAVLYIDLDQFKVVNDTCGHTAGDTLLQQLTSILQSKIRGSDTLARLGGDEFGLLLESCDIDRAEKIANELLTTIQAFRFTWDTYIFKLGASIGVVPVKHDSESIAKILSNADSACYIAKDNGRNRVWVKRQHDTELAKRHGEMELTSLINHALENNEFCLFKQRIVPIDKNDHKQVYELLIRMNSSAGADIMPMAFIPAAERYALMPSIDRWVIKNAFSILSGRPLADGQEEMVSINLSGQSLSQEDFLDYVVNELDESGLDPERICFEVTETAAIANWQHVTRLVSVLRGMGCKFALDDFGSGMSSFSYLRNLNIDFIKIDGSFVRNIHFDSLNREMVKSIHNLGQVMRVKTIAEYVESAEILEELTAIGIDYAQGFSIHMPEPL
ncbi:MAG: EAL domain-containing protein [Gammaproteobacteria bacterium]|nr:EAL domain-containing protein [Gammaproteobacteria bacterium]